MLEDTGARLIVGDSRTRGQLAPLEVQFLCLDQDAAAIAGSRRDHPNNGVTPNNLCTYAYTLGSTGTPKAVMMTRGVASRIQWSHMNAVKVDERDRLLVTASPGYGLFLGEFGLALMQGARQRSWHGLEDIRTLTISST